MFFFIPLSLKHINVLQKSIIEMMNEDTFTSDKYFEKKEEITALRDTCYLSAELLAIVAGLNIVLLVFQVYVNYHFYEKGELNKDNMIYFTFTLLPFLFKGISLIITSSIILLSFIVQKLYFSFIFYIWQRKLIPVIVCILRKLMKNFGKSKKDTMSVKVALI